MFIVGKYNVKFTKTKISKPVRKQIKSELKTTENYAKNNLNTSAKNNLNTSANEWQAEVLNEYIESVLALTEWYYWVAW